MKMDIPPSLHQKAKHQATSAIADLIKVVLSSLVVVMFSACASTESSGTLENTKAPTAQTGNQIFMSGKYNDTPCRFLNTNTFQPGKYSPTTQRALTHVSDMFDLKSTSYQLLALDKRSTPDTVKMILVADGVPIWPNQLVYRQASETLITESLGFMKQALGATSTDFQSVQEAIIRSADKAELGSQYQVQDVCRVRVLEDKSLKAVWLVNVADGPEAYSIWVDDSTQEILKYIPLHQTTQSL